MGRSKVEQQEPPCPSGRQSGYTAATRGGSHLTAAAPSRRITLTQQIFIGLAAGILFGRSSTATTLTGSPRSALQPALFPDDQDDHRAADLRDPGCRNRRGWPFESVGRMGLRAILYFEVVTTIALVIGLVAVNMTQAGRRHRAADRAERHHGRRPGLAIRSCCTRSRISFQGDGARRRAADRRLQHHLRVALGMIGERGKPMIIWCERSPRPCSSSRTSSCAMRRSASAPAIAYTVGHSGLGAL